MAQDILCSEVIGCENESENAITVWVWPSSRFSLTIEDPRMA